MRINYLVASHPHDDHIGGFIGILEYIPVDTLVMSRYKFKSKIYTEILDLCHVYDIPIRYVGRGDQLYPDSTCRVYILHPDSAHTRFIRGNGAECNNSSLVMKVQYGRNGILFTGDLEIEAEPELFGYKDFLECEIIKIGHHGSKTSSSFEFLKFVQPLVGVISVAKKNTFKHPSPGTLQRLRNMHIRTYLTSRTGAQVFYIDPDKIRKQNWINH